MKKEQFLFLVGGFAFGVLVGFGLFKVSAEGPELDPTAASSDTRTAPAGPRAMGGQQPAQAGGGAPMVAEINELKRRLEANPKDSAAAESLAQTYFRVGMLDQSLEFYDIALGILPGDPNVLTDSGNVLRQQGRYAEALDRFRQAHEAAPGHWQSLFNTVVVAAFDMKQWELADAALAKLEGIEPAPAQLPALKKALGEFRAKNGGSPGAP